MRFSGSVYDNLRQSGVYEELEQRTKKNQERMKQTVLARLRLDDLLANDSLEGGDSRLVMSFSDVLDGRLFTLLKPADLEGIELEILCPKSIADDPKSAVPKTLRSWIQNEDRTGREAFFMAAQRGYERTEVASALASRNDLNVTTIKSALEAVGAADESGELAGNLERHWCIWDEAIRKKRITLKPFRNSPASAVLGLETFWQKLDEAGDISAFVKEAGTEYFDQALAILKKNNGRRDSVIKYLREEETSASDDDKVDLLSVKSVVFHYMFEAIVKGNCAIAEHSVMTGENDSFALSEYLFEKMVPFKGDVQKFEVDPRIVSGLGELSGKDYGSVKVDTVIDIRKGIEQFKNDNSNSDSLNKAYADLVSKIGTTVNVPFEGGLRRIIWAGIGGAVTAGVGTAINPTQLDIQISPGTAAGVGGAVVATLAAAEEATGRGTAYVSSHMLKRSLVNASKRELGGPWSKT